MASSNTKRNTSDMIAENELYSTPDVALSNLYALYPEVFDGEYWLDPCYGLGVMGDYLEAMGKTVYKNDIEQYNYNKPLDSVCDYLSDDFNPGEKFDGVIINPPYKLTSEFINRSLQFSDKVLMFNRVNILEGKSRGKMFVYGDWNLKTFYPFTYRVSCDKGVNQDKTANAVFYGWYEFDNYYQGHPTIKWIY